jgi:hypothetical protein
MVFVLGSAIASSARDWLLIRYLIECGVVKQDIYLSRIPSIGIIE